MEKLGNKFIKRVAGQNLDVDSSSFKKSKVSAIYIGANYAKPCQKFINVLIDFYKTANKKDKDNFEVLYISMDQKESEYLNTIEYLNIPFLMYNFRDQQRIKAYMDLKEHIEGIPALLIVSKENKIINKDGRYELETHGLQVFKQWIQQINDFQAKELVEQEE